ncbi:glycerol-3-phosphate dehydrogenase/oxidase [candidate division KSB1 bacterium]|nr:glycerol-3-phosphate dehydrogenase/oxidase [candidate division KSB1 bacterium]
MQRDTMALTRTEFDVLVVGGGIYGATIAWEAVLQGLKTALIEKADFASGTSANSLKTIHGGLRYLQHLDFVRMRESIMERRLLSAIAPHQIHPLPCIMPTYGHLIKGPEAMRMALLMNDIIGWDRNRLKDRSKHLPAGRILAKKRVLELFPYFDIDNMNGGALWYDAQMYNSERLLLSFIHSATQRGALALNYVEADDLMMENGRVIGVQATDHISGEQMPIRARVTLNASGPWINDLLQRARPDASIPLVPFSTALNLVINRPLTERFAFGVPSKCEFRDADAVINKGSRLLFVAPWRGVTLVGTDHKPYDGRADDYRVTESDIQVFLQQVNEALPSAKISRDEVTFFYGGLLPMAGVNPHTGDVQLEKHFKTIDYGAEYDLEGLIGLLSVKYTTARGVAETAVQRVLQKLGKKMAASNGRSIRIWGGEIDDYNAYMEAQIRLHSPRLTPQVVRHLVNNYGSRYEEVLHLVDADQSLAEPVHEALPILKAEVTYGVREEMAVHLTDIILRRTEMGSTGSPDDEALLACAQVMAAELGWSPEQMFEEILCAKAVYRPAAIDPDTVARAQSGTETAEI